MTNIIRHLIWLANTKNDIMLLPFISAKTYANILLVLSLNFCFIKTSPFSLEDCKLEHQNPKPKYVFLLLQRSVAVV